MKLTEAAIKTNKIIGTYQNASTCVSQPYTAETVEAMLVEAGDNVAVVGDEVIIGDFYHFDKLDFEIEASDELKKVSDACFPAAPKTSKK